MSSRHYLHSRAVAILLALTRISFIICSDSHSALQAFGSLYPPNSLVLKIQRFLCDLHSYHKSVSFCWVPSHVGLPPNERAARQTPDINFAFPFRDYFRTFQRSIQTTWKSRWNQCVTDGNKLCQLRPTIGPWQSSCHRNRHHEVALARLRIGHARVTHCYIMACEAPAICTRCRVRFSVSHILVDCPSYHTARCWFFPALPSVCLISSPIPHNLTAWPCLRT